MQLNLLILGNECSLKLLIRYSVECASFLKEKYNISALIAACNTISSHAIPDLDNSLNIPVLGVIKPNHHYTLFFTIIALKFAKSIYF